MATQVQFRRGTAAQNDTFTGGSGELSINLSTMAVRVHDGSTAGGFELARADLTNVTGNIPAQPGGANASVQFNNLGTLSGSTTYTFDNINQIVTMPNVEVVGAVASSLIPNANVTFDLGNSTNMWRDLYLSGNTIYIGNANIKSYQQTVLIQGLSITANGAVDVANAPANGGLYVAGAGNFAANVNIVDIMTSAEVHSNIANIANSITSPTATITGNLDAANITSNGTITANVMSVETLVVTDITVTGNLAPNKINFTDSIVNIGAANADITVTVAGTTNVAVFTTAGTTTTGLVVTGTTDLGNAGNVTITGGNANAFLQTDGNGNLTWASVDASSVSNGTSNLTIPVVDGEVLVGVGGTPNVIVAASTGVTVTNLTVDGKTNLGAVSNITIANGTNGQYLQTDGNGNITWASISGSGISNGTSDVSIAVANGNVVTTVDGNAIITAAAAGANVTGTLDVTGNVTVSNITSNGKTSLGAVANVSIANGSNGQFLRTDGSGNLTWATVQSDRISNGNTSVAITTVDGNVTVTVANNNVVNFTGTGANVAGTANITGAAAIGGALDVSGNITASANVAVTGSLDVTANAAITGTLGVTGNTSVVNIDASGKSNLNSIGNITITGGNSGQAIKTDGNGVLSFANIPGGSNTQIQFNNDGNLAGADLYYFPNGNSTFVQFGTINEAFTTGEGITLQHNSQTSTQFIRLDDTANALTTSVATSGISTTGTLDVANTATFTGNALFSGADISLGNVANLHIANGTSGQVLSTDGAGNLSWATVSSDRISNSNSNVVIDSANGNILFGANNQANVIIVTSDGTRAQTTISNDVTVTGNLTVSGNATYINTTSQYIIDAIIDQGVGADNGPLTSDDAKDRGVSFHTYGTGATYVTSGSTPQGNTTIVLASTVGIVIGQEVAFDGAITHGTKVTTVNAGDIVIDTPTTAVIADTSTVAIGLDKQHFFGWDASGSEFLFAANATITNGLVTHAGNLGNVRLGNLVTEATLVEGTFTANGNANFDVGNVLFSGPNVTFSGPDVHLGAVSDIYITGGLANAFLQTDGNGNLSWNTVNSDRISNGNSNVFVYANSNVAITAEGNANIVVVTGVGANVAGTLDVTGNVTLANLTANGITDLGAVANVKIANGSSGQLLQTDGNGNLSWTTITSAAPQKYSLEWNIDAANGDDTNGSGGEEKPYKTIAKALTVAAAGDVIYLHAGTYTETITLTAGVTIIGTGESTILDGAWIYNSTANSYISGVKHIGTVTVNNSGTTVFDNAILSDAVSVTSGAIAQFNHSAITTSIGVSGATAVTFNSGKTKGLTVNGNGAIVRVNSSERLEDTTLTAGSLYVNDSAVFTSVGPNPSITGGGGTLYLDNSTLYNTTEAALGYIQGSFDYNLVNATYDVDASTLSGTEVTSRSTVTGIAQVANLTVTTTANLGTVANVKLAGGSNLQFLQTDGAGNLVWANPSATSIVNGNSNVVVDINSTIRFSAIGNANVITIDDQDANIATKVNLGRTLSVVGNTNVSNITANGNVQLGNIANVHVDGGANGDFLFTDGSGNLSFGIPVLSSLTNGNSNVIVNANGNVNISSGGSTDMLIVTKTGANIAGTANVTGVLEVGANIDAAANINISSNLVVTGTSVLTGNVSITNVAVSGKTALGNVGNVAITGGNSGQFLATDGAGNLSWANAGAAGSNMQVQFNDGGSQLGGNAKFTFDKANANLTVDKISILGAGNINANGALAIQTAAVTTLSILGGNATSAGDTGGNILVRAGDSPDLSTAGGKLTLQAGDALGGTNGGNAYLIAGNSATGQAGNIYIAPGTGANANVSGQTVFSGKVNLGAVGNIKISGGSNNQILTTDGAGNLTWGAGSNLVVSSISDGNSNVRIASSNGNVVMAVAGTDVFTMTATGAIIGNGAPLAGLTNPIVGASSNANSYVQSYIYNLSNTVHASADFVAYPNNGTDSSGWVDLGITSNSFVDTTFSVTGRNESYLFASAPAGSGTSGNLVIATDKTGSNNAIEFYTGGFDSAKGANRPMYMASNEVKISGNLAANGANVSLGAVGNLHITGAADGAILMANGTGGNLVWGLVLDGGTA